MDEDIKGLGDYLHILKRRKWQFIVPALLLALISAAAALLLPSVYRSTATILIEQQEIPQDLVRSTVTSFADQRIQTISQRVMTSVNLAKIIEKFDLYKKERRTESMVSVVQEMRDDIQLEMVSADVVDPRSGRPMEATIAFTLSYENRSPDIAQKVANEIVSLFLEENLRVRRESAKETTRFLEEEAQSLSERISDLEAKLAIFKEKNTGALPEYSQLNQQMMDRTEREISNVDQQIRALEERKVYLRSELSQLNPSGSIYTVDGERLLGPADRLKALRVQYISMATKYAENHPDIVKVKREIKALKQELGIEDDAFTLRAQLEAQKSSLAKLEERYSADHPEVQRLQRAIAATETALKNAGRRPASNQPLNEVADNPAYVQLKSQLDGAEVELRSLKIQRAELKQRLLDLEKKMMRTPQVEREYKALTRDYDNALLKYREIKAKQQEAQLAQSLEEERKGERFSLIEPPLFPEKPAKPNRLAILFLGFVFSIGAGIGHVALRESLDDTIHSSKDAVELLHIPPMAVVPYIQNSLDVKKERSRLALFILIGVALVAGAAAAVHTFVMPLDVLWYSMLRRAGELGQKLR
ncbi:MAG TPA: lipopolysaccharide biosynthesis protein [Chromatiales bacterium]|nr:lipopolysaccharide biosynthesis protein [Chromatiales bacterium]